MIMEDDDDDDLGHIAVTSFLFSWVVMCVLTSWLRRYTSIDQILAPLYMGLFLLVVDFVPLLKRTLVSPQEQEESIGQAIRATWQKIRCVALLVHTDSGDDSRVFWFALDDVGVCQAISHAGSSMQLWLCACVWRCATV
jgi:hypothetical protein